MLAETCLLAPNSSDHLYSRRKQFSIIHRAKFFHFSSDKGNVLPRNQILLSIQIYYFGKVEDALPCNHLLNFANSK